MAGRVALPREGIGGPLLVVTGLWPSSDMPSAGIFVQRRLRGVRATVIGPGNYSQPTLLRYLKLLWRALTARGRFRGVEAHVLFPAGAIGLLAARLRGVPLLVYAHGSDVRVTAQENPVYHALSRYVARHADALLTNSQATAELIHDTLGREAVVISPGVDLDLFRPSPRPTDRRVLYLGGRTEHKGYDIARECADTLVGPGLLEVEPSDVAALIAEHDIVLVPSRHEPFGLVAAEAIAAGRWVVGSDTGGLREIITDGVNGTLVKDGGYRRAIVDVPDYDPFALAATVAQFSVVGHQARMAEMWRTVLMARETDRGRIRTSAR